MVYLNGLHGISQICSKKVFSEVNKKVRKIIALILCGDMFPHMELEKTTKHCSISILIQIPILSHLLYEIHEFHLTIPKAKTNDFLVDWWEIYTQPHNYQPNISKNSQNLFTYKLLNECRDIKRKFMGMILLQGTYHIFITFYSWGLNLDIYTELHPQPVFI